MSAPQGDAYDAVLTLSRITAEALRRPCCGVTAPVERLWPGSFHFPHRRACERAA